MTILFKVVPLFMVLMSPYALAQGVDEMWEISGHLEMDGGMKMPIPPTRTCMKKDAAVEPPAQENCRISDLTTAGNKTTWRVICDEPNKAEGSGEMIKTADKIQGSARMTSADGNVTMRYSGHRVGACTHTPARSIKK